MDELPLTPENVERLNQLYYERSKDDFTLFHRGLIIPSASGPRLFSSCMAPFQKECFALLAPSIHAVRDGTMPVRRRFWIARTKGAGKDSDLACCLMWLVAFPTRPCYLQVGAADRDQAAIVKRRMEDLVHYNPWMDDYVEIQRYRITSKPRGWCVMDILAADIAGSHGERPDLLVINELSHVAKWEFIQNLLDNARKASRGVTLIATNAGFRGTKAETMRNNAASSPARWTMNVWKTPAPWISKEDVQEAVKNDLPSRVNRLWYGRWASGKGDALAEEAIDRCLSFHKGPITRPEKNWQYVAGLDLGVSHDHAGLAIVGVNQVERRVRLAWMKGWAPDNRGGEVDLIDVENTVLGMSKTFKLRSVSYDPTEARLMAQQLKRKGVPMFECSFASPKNLTTMAACLVQLVGTGSLEAYDDEEGRLRRDFGKLNIVEKNYGYKLEAVSDEHGHADVATALAIVLPKAVDLLAGRVGLQVDDVLVDGDEKDLTEDEIKDLPDELRELYGTYDELDHEKR